MSIKGHMMALRRSQSRVVEAQLSCLWNSAVSAVPAVLPWAGTVVHQFMFQIHILFLFGAMEH